jgi:hypothetical protein
MPKRALRYPNPPPRPHDRVDGAADHRGEHPAADPARAGGARRRVTHYRRKARDTISWASGNGTARVTQGPLGTPGPTINLRGRLRPVGGCWSAAGWLVAVADLHEAGFVGDDHCLHSIP